MNPNGVAKRLRKLSLERSNTVLMETIVCGSCGQRFTIHHDAALQDIELARKQASWVENHLVWDHIQERKHHGCIDLPKLQ